MVDEGASAFSDTATVSKALVAMRTVMEHVLQFDRVKLRHCDYPSALAALSTRAAQARVFGHVWLASTWRGTGNLYIDLCRLLAVLCTSATFQRAGSRAGTRLRRSAGYRRGFGSSPSLLV